MRFHSNVFHKNTMFIACFALIALSVLKSCTPSDSLDEKGNQAFNKGEYAKAKGEHQKLNSSFKVPLRQAQGNNSLLFTPRLHSVNPQKISPFNPAYFNSFSFRYPKQGVFY